MRKALSVGGISAGPGELRYGFIKGIELPDTTRIDIPIMVANGRKEGPTLLLTAAVHGTEIVGTEVIRRILREKVDLATLSGAIIAIPVANRLAMQQSQWASPFYTHNEQGNLYIAFPGDPNGGITSRLAHEIAQIILRSDYLIDIHCVPPVCTPFTELPTYGKSRAKRTSKEMCDAFGITTVYEAAGPGIPSVGYNLISFGAINNVPSILAECPSWRTFSTWDPARQSIATEPAVEMGLRGVLNVMKRVRMVEGEVEKQTVPTVGGYLTSRTVRSSHGGLVHMEKNPPISVSSGEILVRILNLFGDEVEAIKSPYDGYFLGCYFFESQAVVSGEEVVYVAKPAAEEVEIYLARDD